VSEPAIALVFSPEPWVERLHRHLADHGGARVRQIVLDPTLALEEHYDALVVSHRWPGLTHRLVAAVGERGRSVLGVFDPDEPAGRDHLRALGVDHVVAADEPVTRFVELLGELPRSRSDAWPAAPGPELRVDRAAHAAAGVVVTGGAGAGVTEVALALAHAGSRRRATVLVDARERGGALAVRLGLPLEPGLRDAVEAVEHAAGTLSDALTHVATRFDVLPGVTTGALAPAAPHEVQGVVAALVATGRAPVVDASADDGAGRALLADADAVVFVAAAAPTGVAHALAWASEHPALFPTTTHLVLNRAPRERFRRAELERELVRTLGPTKVWFLPTDARVDDAAWDGALVRRGPFVVGVERIAAALAAAVPSHDRHVPRRRRKGRAA
jgi:MinD-like ATPase involved in chromosome partitioning or flagellar assembly